MIISGSDSLKVKSVLTNFRNILVASDFSPHSTAALKLAIWLAGKSGNSESADVRVTVANVVSNLREAAHATSYRAKLDMLSGDGDLFQKEIRYASSQKLLLQIQQAGATSRQVQSETLLGEAYEEITHAVQQEGYDLVMAGTRGVSGWKQFFVGSTARKLIRNCPAAVWIVKEQHSQPPRVVLAPTDFSDVSRKAVQHGINLARQSSAEFHLLHVIDSNDVPDDIVEHIPAGSSVRQEINREAESRLDEFLRTLETTSVSVNSHLSWGYAWQEIARISQKHNVDVISLGTVGRSGIRGVVLGNTAERVLDSCDCSILTVKPDDFVSPISRPTWPLHP